MNRAHRFRSRVAMPFAGKWLTASLCVCLAGFVGSAFAAPQLATPPILAPAAATSAQVKVSQQPLTIGQPIPPNIVLMLDDSGSMAWNVMPDWSYLTSRSDDALIDSSNNGVYYNPAITYLPPPKADSTAASPDTFPNETDMTNVPSDGIAESTTVNLFAYGGAFDSLATCGSPGTAGCAGSSVPYTTAGASSHYAYPRDYRDSHSGYLLTSWPGKNYDFATKAGCDNWYHDFDTNRSYRPYYAYAEAYDAHNETCTIYWHTTPGPYYFQYSTGPADGPYVVHYVAQSDCSGSPDPSNCVVATDAGAGGNTDAASIELAQAAGAPAGVTVGENIANWFAYYHTRILMAKTGLMRAFASMSGKYRLGFGSINNNNKDYIIDNLPHTEKQGTYIATVDVYGDGASGSQRANFWTWVEGESAKSSTPLRAALAGVGEYYQTGQPWTTMSSDPDYGKRDQPDYLACRQSYTILTTDGFWNGSYSSGTIAGATNRPGPIFPAPASTAQVGYMPVEPFSGGGTSSGSSPSLADVATYYWENDLQPGHANEVPTDGSVDPAFWQHMVTFTMGMGFTPTHITGTAPSGNSPPLTDDIFKWSEAGGGPTSTYAINGFGWPTPAGAGGSGGSINNIADLEHAGVNGHGGFFSATDPQSFISGLETALGRIAKVTGSGASVAANSTDLNNGTVLFQASYNNSRETGWTGALASLAIVNGNVASSPTWDAAKEMPAPPERNIYTYAPGGSDWTAGSGAYVEFKVTGGTLPALSAAQHKALSSYGPAPAIAASTAVQAGMIDYLRGDHAEEQTETGAGGVYRERKSTVLGDIVDSQPVYVAPPDPNAFSGETFNGSTSYAGFVAENATRTGLIYVAANDGMLHAFNASNYVTIPDPTTGGTTHEWDSGTGKEVYAFLPADVITHGGVNGAGQTIGISELANPAYGTQAAPHQYFNDGQLTVAAAYFDGAWHTVLIGTTGRGMARAIYALDVTDPTDIKFLWERSAWDGGANSGYIGQMSTKPIIAQVGNGDWAVLIGNGYNSANGVAALLQFKLSDGTLSVHKTTDSTTGNGLAAPAVWIGDPGNGVSTVAYAGDLHGHVWSFPLSKVTVADGVSSITTLPDSTGTLLFTAKNDDNEVQPITAGMLVGTDPDTGNRWVFFGTGRYLSADDIPDTNVQSWYGLIVDAPGDAALVSNLLDGRSSLAKRAIIAQTAGDPTASPPVSPARVVSPPDDANTESISGKSGWYIDLQTPTMNADGTATGYVSSGERMVVPNQFHTGRLIGTSIIPKSNDLCNPSGTGWVMAVEPFTGTNPRPQFFDINGDGHIDSADMIQVGGKSYAAAGVGFAKQPNSPIFLQGNMYTNLHNKEIVHNKVNDSSNTLTRVSWREMVNP